MPRQKIIHDEGRTTLHIVDEKKWQFMKKRAKELGYASVSEFIFDVVSSYHGNTDDLVFWKIIGKQIDQFEERVIKLIRDTYATKNLTVGMIAGVLSQYSDRPSVWEVVKDIAERLNKEELESQFGRLTEC